MKRGTMASVAAKKRKARRELPKRRGEKRTPRYSSLAAFDAALREHCSASGNDWAIAHAESFDRVNAVLECAEGAEGRARAILRKLVRDAAPLVEREGERAYEDTNMHALRRVYDIAKWAAWRRPSARERLAATLAYWDPHLTERQIALVTLLSLVGLNTRRAACREGLTLTQALRREERDNRRLVADARRDGAEDAGTE